MTTPNAQQSDFTEVVQLIETARQQSYQAVNTHLIKLYWQIGAYISAKLNTAQWGDAVVNQLANHLALTSPNLKREFNSEVQF